MLAHGLDRLDDWRAARRRAGKMLVAVDFDGTLAPIVDRPEDAAALSEGREALTRLVSRPDTDVAVVSGRGLDDVRERLGVPGVYYAGNHGMEIDGPGIHRRHPQAAAARGDLDRCLDSLKVALGSLEGVQIEDKGLTASIHYRRTRNEEIAERVRRTVHEHCGGFGMLRLTEGKMVVEVRPAVEWDKGRATRFLLDALSSGRGRPPVLFIGDDRTDEDAFRALADDGEGVVVGDPPPEDTAASCWVRDPREVAALLAGLARGD